MNHFKRHRIAIATLFATIGLSSAPHGLAQATEATTVGQASRAPPAATGPEPASRPRTAPAKATPARHAQPGAAQAVRASQARPESAVRARAKTPHGRESASKPAASRPAPPDSAQVYADREEVRDFISSMADRHGFDPAALNETFAKVRRSPEVLRLIAPPPAGFRKSWDAYRTRFLDPLRINEGVRFWQEHEAALERAREAWGVPPEFVVAIIGVETIYGRITGNFRVVDALATLAFDYPRRAPFFREELEHYLLLARDQRFDPLQPRGSYAGAIGLPQFMPGSIRRHATDFDGDGRIDLATSPVDAIGSVARFLSRHGWVPGEPTHFEATIADPHRLGPLIDSGIEPQWTIDELAQWGVGSTGPIGPDVRLALIDLPNGDRPPSYVLGARNFHVITRYNRSSFYAMAVIELARALARAR